MSKQTADISKPNRPRWCPGTPSTASGDRRALAVASAPGSDLRCRSGSPLQTLLNGGISLLIASVLVFSGTPALAQAIDEDPPAQNDRNPAGMWTDRSAFQFGGYGSRATRNLDLEKMVRDFTRMRAQKAISYFVFAQEAIVQRNFPLAAMYNSFSLMLMPTEDGWIQRFDIMTEAGRTEEALASLIEASSHSKDAYYQPLYEGIEAAKDVLKIEADLDDRTLYESIEAGLSDFITQEPLPIGYYNMLPGRTGYDATVTELHHAIRFLEFFFGGESHTGIVATGVFDPEAATPPAEPDTAEAKSDPTIDLPLNEFFLDFDQFVPLASAAEPDIPEPPYVILLGPHDTAVEAIINQARLKVFYPTGKLIRVGE